MFFNANFNNLMFFNTLKLVYLNNKKHTFMKIGDRVQKIASDYTNGRIPGARSILRTWCAFKTLKPIQL